MEVAVYVGRIIVQYYQLDDGATISELFRYKLHTKTTVIWFFSYEL